MTTSKSDLEAKEGQVPDESNFLEFVSLLGSLSSRAGGSGAQDDRGSEVEGDSGAPEEDDPQPTGWFLRRRVHLHIYRLSHTLLVWICWQNT